MIAKIRSTRPGVAATIFMEQAGRARLVLTDPESGVSPGQAAVFYDGDRVLGGGWIAGAVSTDPRLAAA